MSNDIFDDVDEILNQEVETSDTPEATHADAEFNESELEDIMAEIENLESELEKEIATPEALKVNKEDLKIEQSVEVKNKLQDAIENELQEFSKNNAVESAADESNVVAIQPTMKASLDESMSFQAKGNMDISLQFKVGQEVAKLTVDGQSGLSLSLSGVEIFISEDGGCSVSMENGVKFSIPVSKVTKKSQAA